MHYAGCDMAAAKKGHDLSKAFTNRKIHIILSGNTRVVKGDRLKIC